ncbi:helicase-exonuclease AddAB subunit AddA [Acetobacterium sp. KB-1]|jgi:ATP-dependent helicase/nuclease subunit A|uniref:helicase-exonuclease AddAB subunit AddA n=1 Tax=Acetobacterium sp. KB-1 TaxID=2184575 RepID=UPI000DBECA5B|nr:helicase-exonuclease AddAB subunit AddA [Acetobacterium sp. KB-1]AWW26462.1 helicase-exonuclease AddAB subunit AddA [Acetobacterium sp. KB-1]
MKWTSDQLKAIKNRETNMLVSAAAGSGKTALLIERIIRIIREEKVGVDELLILTFTRGAAGEMKNRLSQALAKELENPENDRSFLMKQLNILGGASISTLHSFCLGILHQYFHKGDIDPGFAIGNDTEIALMLKETLEEVFEDEYQQAITNENSANKNMAQNSEEEPERSRNKNEQSLDFLDLIEKYSGNKNDQALKDTVETLYRFLATQPNPENWSNQALLLFDCDVKSLEDSVWGCALKKIIETELQGAIDAAIEAGNLSTAVGFEKTHEQSKSEVQMLKALEKTISTDLVQGLEALKSLSYERFKGAAKQDKELNELIKKYRDEAKTSMVKLQKRFAINIDEMVQELNSLKKPMADLVLLTQKFWTAFQAKKAQKNLVDYNDLEQLTLKILGDPEVADEVRARYRYIFLDEYQDTNEMQETILKRIVRDNNYFMVGDVKQSIYRFRLADPTIFIGKYKSFGKDENLNNSLVTLNQNFRSAQGVVNSVNAIFEKIMSVGLGEINYDEQARLNKGLPHDGPYQKTEIHIIEEQKQEAGELQAFEEQEQEDLTAVEIEARFVAEKIQSLVGTTFFDTRNNQERAINYGDFGVLMRSVAGRGDVYLKVFSEMGIPTYFDGGTNYYESLEITMILNLLNLMDNQHQDLPLLSIMTSPIGNFSTTECTRLRIAHPQGFFYQAVESYCQLECDELSKKLGRFYQKLTAWRNQSKLMPVEDFLWKIYLESGYYAFVGALPGGEQRQCNLRILLKRAGDYKKSTLKGLYQFIRFVENMKKHKQDISPPAMVSNQETVVRLMTIHKSKGLEFPIVILSGTGKGFNKRSNYAQVLFHKDLGICPDYVNLEKRYKHNSLAKEVCKAQSNQEMLSEEMRLLYVGMTRAEEKLVIVGTVKNHDKAKQKWHNEPDEYHLLNAASLLDWVMMGVLAGRDPSETNPELADFTIAYHQGTQFTEKQALEREDRKDPANELQAIDPEMETPAAAPEKLTTSISQADREAIFQRLNFLYPVKAENELPSKMSVTEIKDYQKADLTRQQEKIRKLSKKQEKPKFLEQKQTDFTAAQRGSALHLLMEVVDLKPIREELFSSGQAALPLFLKKYLVNQIETLIHKEFLPAALARTISVDKLISFYTSALGIRLLSAEKIRREIPFNYAYDPAEIRLEWTDIREKIIVQGIIDCAFMEDQKWVIIDYKTDYFKDPQQREQVLRGYEIQINLYAKALTELTGVPVKEKVIGLITLNEAISIV